MAVPPSPAQVPPPAQVEKQPSTPPPQKVSTTTIVLSILLLVVLGAAIVTVIFFDQIAANPSVQKLLTRLPQLLKQENIVALPTAPPTPTAQPTPSYLPPGKETYMIGKMFEEGFPKITMLTLDPIDVKKDEQQSIEVTVTSPTPVTSVNVTLYADNKHKQTTQLTSQKDGTSTTWRGSWTVQSFVWYRYVVMITATNTLGESKVYVAVRTVGPLKKSELE